MKGKIVGWQARLYHSNDEGKGLHLGTCKTRKKAARFHDRMMIWFESNKEYRRRGTGLNFHISIYAADMEQLGQTATDKTVSIGKRLPIVQKILARLDEAYVARMGGE